MVNAYLERIESLEEQVQALEAACDHHKMFWQKAEERERGLKEQLEAVRQERDNALSAYHKLKKDYEDLRDHRVVLVNSSTTQNDESRPEGRPS